MINIRPLMHIDIEDVKRVGQRYAKETLVGNLTDDQLTHIALSCMKDGIVLVAEKDNKIVGVIAGKFIEGFSMGKFCEEVIWYVEPEHRGIGLLLFNKFIECCKKSECTGLAMIAYNNEYLGFLDGFYKDNGFSEIERRYYKKF